MKFYLVLILTLSSLATAELPISFSDGTNEVISSSNIMRIFINRNSTPALTKEFIEKLKEQYKKTPNYEKVKNMSPTQGSVSYSINCVFDNFGLEQLATFTEQNVGKTIAIHVGGNVVSTPNINEPILKGEAQITGIFTLEELTKFFPREHSKVYYNFSD